MKRSRSLTPPWSWLLRTSSPDEDLGSRRKCDKITTLRLFRLALSAFNISSAPLCDKLLFIAKRFSFEGRRRAQSAAELRPRPIARLVADLATWRKANPLSAKQVEGRRDSRALPTPSALGGRIPGARSASRLPGRASARERRADGAKPLGRSTRQRPRVSAAVICVMSPPCTRIKTCC
jgi:hypothetical protein